MVLGTYFGSFPPDGELEPHPPQIRAQAMLLVSLGEITVAPLNDAERAGREFRAHLIQEFALLTEQLRPKEGRE